MSEITVRYQMTVDDLVHFNDVAFRKNIILMRAVCVFFMIMTTFMSIMMDNVPLGIAEFIVFAAIFIVYPFLIKRQARKGYSKAYILGRDNQVEFYNDHLVERVFPKYEGAYESEMHVPFEKIMNITETEDMFLFFISPIEAIGIPVSAFTDEDKVKLSNLIANVFKERYTKIESFKSYKNNRNQ